MTAITTGQAARIAGLPASSFRAEMSRARKRGIDCRRPRAEWPDGRTPLWDAEAVEAWRCSRPGRGARIDLR